MLTEHIDSLNFPGLEVFTSLTDKRLRTLTEQERGIFIAESPKVIKRALVAGCYPLALLCEGKHIEGDAAEIISLIERRNPEAKLFTGERDVLAALTGYTLTRGVLCAMQRPEMPEASTMLARARRVAVLEDISDAVNVGAIMRSAAALGLDGVVIDTQSCDVLNRRAVRVSMGNVFMIPKFVTSDPIGLLKDCGFKCAALALRENTLPIDARILKKEPRLAIVLGNEGNGLKQATIDRCDYTVKIPMLEGVDSLNVAAAAAVAFWELRLEQV